MTDTEKRIAIAEFCGLKQRTYFCEICGKNVPEREIGGEPPGGLRHDVCGSSDVRLHGYVTAPDYLNDLNAIHEAEEKLIPSECVKYADWLHLTVRLNRETWHSWIEFAAINATARQRADALLKTLGFNP